MSASALSAILATNIILAILNPIVNIVLIYALKATDQLRSISCRLIACLSVSDICIAVILQNLLSITVIAFKDEQNCVLELSGQFFAFIFPQISGVMMLIIALDRWLHMKYLSKYAIIVNWKRASFMIVTNVIIALVIAVCSIFASIYNKFFIFNIILVVTDFSVIVFTYIAYILTFRSVRKQAKSIRKRNQDDTSSYPAISSDISKKTRKRDAELAKTMIFILTSLTFGYVPYFVVGLYWSYLRYHRYTATSSSLDASVWCCFLFVYILPSLNAIIFIRRNKKAYRWLKRRLGAASSPEVSPTTELSGQQQATRSIVLQ